MKVISKKQLNLLKRYLPILEWLPQYDRSNLAGDILGGFSVWAVLVPVSIGTALISAVPAQHGLYAVVAASFVYPIFASSRQVITGPATALAAITGAAVLAISTPNSAEAVQLVAAITLLAGILYIVFSLLRMGWISNFLSQSVLIGFIFGIGISVVISQMHNITGTTETGANAWGRLFNWIQGLAQTNLLTLAIGLTTLVLLFTLKLYVPRLPGALLAVALGILVELVFNLSEYGVTSLGTVPRGLPTFTLPNMDLVMNNLQVVLPAAVSLFLVSMSASLAAGREYASRYHYDIDVNQEMLAQGAANAVSGLFRGLGVYGYLGITSVSDSAGGKTELASLVLSLMAILTLLFLAPVFSYVPLAVLGAVLIEVVVFGLWKIPQMKRLWHLARTEFWLALAALLGVLTFGILQGMLIGVGLSLLWLVWRASHPAVPELGRMPDSLVYHSLEKFPDSEKHPGVVVIRFDGPLFFATASRLRERIRELITEAESEVSAIILDMESTNIIDLEGSEAILMVVKELQSVDIELHLVRIKQEILEILEKDGVIDAVGRDRLRDYVHEAVEAVKSSERRNNNVS